MSDVELLSFPAVADALGVAVTRIHQYVRDGQLVAARDAEGRRGVPTLLVQDGAVVKSLPAVVTLLRDAGYSDDDVVDWLHRADDTLPGTPIEALRENRGSEVKRRAQAAGF